MKLLQSPVVLSFALAACGSDAVAPPGGQTGEESFGCVTVTEEVVPLAQSTRLGFSGSDMLALVGGERLASLTWSDDTQADLTIETTSSASTAALRDNEWSEPQDGREIGSPDCNDALALDATVRFVTADGSFDERFYATLVASTSDRVLVYIAREADEVAGSYRATDAAPTDGRVRLFWSFEFDSEGVTGTIDGQVETTSSAGPDGTASAQGFDIATFGEE